MRITNLFRFLEDAEARRKGIRIWVALVLLWSIGRSIAVATVFDKYGLNPRIYFAIDFLSSVPYAFASAQSLLAYIDGKKVPSLLWGSATLVTFYLPDIYIVTVAKRVPPNTYLGFTLILLVFSALAFKQWKEKRR